MFHPDYFLPSTHDLTDRSAEILSMLQTRGACLLGSGIYAVSGVDMPDSTSLMGLGSATKILLLPEVTDGYALRLGSFCTVKDVHFTGSEEEITLPRQVGTRHGLAFLGNATLQDWRGQSQSATVTGCFFTSFTGGGIYCNDTGYNVQSAMTVSDCHCHNCGAGIYIAHFSEFHRFTNMHCTHCLYGCINNGGNNFFVNCGFDANVTGFLIDNSRDQSPNNSHGSVLGCSFNHSGGNGGIGIQILGARSGYSFTGCQIFYSHIVLDDADKVIFSGLNTGRQVQIRITGGGLVMFSDCSFGALPEAICIENNDCVKFIDCYTSDGTAIPIKTQ